MKKLQDFLETIPDKDDYRKNLRKPFLQEVKGKLAVNATDCHIVISSFDEDLIKGSNYEISEKPLLDKTIEEFDSYKDYKNVVLEVEKLKRCLEQVEKNKERKYVGTCSECGGAGMVEWEYVDNNGEQHFMEYDCPVCNGTGSVNTITIEEYDTMTAIDIDGAKFTPNIIEKVVEWLNTIEKKSVPCKVIQYPNTALLINDKEYLLLAMGLRPTCEEDYKIINYDF